MLIPYPYIPSRDDLWLYKPHTVSMSTPSPASFSVLRPEEWNPGCVLYPYRNSLQGISAKYRTFSTIAGTTGSGVSPEVVAWYAQFNDPNDPANYPVFRNSWPVQQSVIALRMMIGCAHCYNTYGFRNPSLRLVGSGGYAVGSYADAVITLRFLGPNNEVLADIDTQDVILPYAQDASPAFNYVGDASLWETLADIPVERMQLVNPQTMRPGQAAYLIDGNSKVIRCAYDGAWSVAGHDQYAFHTVRPDGEDDAGNTRSAAFVHDSGSIILCEIEPPTSAEAGDGIMGLVGAHIYTTNDFNYNGVVTFATPGYADIPATGWLATHEMTTLQPESSPSNLRAYCAARGYPTKGLRTALRTDAAAKQSVQLNQKSRIEAL